MVSHSRREVRTEYYGNVCVRHPTQTGRGQEGEWRENRGWLIGANEMQIFYCIIVPGRKLTCFLA